MASLAIVPVAVRCGHQNNQIAMPVGIGNSIRSLNLSPNASLVQIRTALTRTVSLARARHGERAFWPAMVLSGAIGPISKLFDIPAEWLQRCENLVAERLPGGHFCVDELPVRTHEALASFLCRRDLG